MEPSIGRIVHYKLNNQDADGTNRRRADFAKAAPQSSGLVAHVGNEARAGDIYPAMIVRVWGSTAESAVQLQVFLDGTDTLWATSVCEASQHRQHTPDNLHPERSYIWPNVSKPGGDS